MVRRATDIQGGAAYGYKLLIAILLSNFAAMFLQFLSLKLGVVAERDLAQACRDAYPKVMARHYIMEGYLHFQHTNVLLTSQYFPMGMHVVSTGGASW